MNIKILFIGGSQRLSDEWFKNFAEPSTIIKRTHYDVDTPNLEYELYEHLAIHNIINKTINAEKKGYDAVVIGCFYDPGLRESRELVKIPVVGSCEASLHVASMITAGKFSIIVGRRKMIPKMADNARNYGFESKIASWRVLNLRANDMGSIQHTILNEARCAVEEDLAECIVCGCGEMTGQTDKIQKELGVPVLDPVLMSIKIAELRAILWKRFKISHSKIGGYESPPFKEFKEIYKKFFIN